MALAIDSSTPAAVSTNASVTNLTTASFTPPEQYRRGRDMERQRGGIRDG